MEQKKGKNFSANNSSGNRRKSDFYETPYSLIGKFVKANANKKRR